MSGGMSSCLPMSGGMSSCLPKSGDMSSCLLLYHTSCSSYRKLQNNRFSPQTEPVENLFPSGAGEDGESRTRSRSRRCVAASEGHRPLDSRASPSPTRDASSLDYWRRVRSLSRETRLRQEARERHLQKVELEERRRRQQILSERKIERDALMTRFLREPLRQHRAARAAKSTSGRDEGDAAGGGGGGGRATREEREARRNVLASRSVPDLEEALRVVRGEDEALDVRARAFLSPRQMRHRAPKEDQGICDRYLRTQSRATVQRRTPGPTPRWGVAPPGYTEIRENQKPYPALSHEMPPPERQVAPPRSRHLRGRSSVDSGCKRSNTLSDTLSVTSSEERDAEYLLSEYCPPSDSHIMVLPRPRLDRRSSMPDLRDYRCVSSAVMYETIATLGSLGDTRGLLVLPPWGHDDHTTLTASAPPHIHHTKNNGENLHRSPKKWAQKMNKFIENETNAVLQTSPLLSALPPSLGRPSSQKGRRSQRKEWVSKHTSMKTLQKKILPTSLTDSSSQTDGMQYMRPTSAVHHRCNSLGSEGAESVYYDSLEEDESRNNTKRSVNQAFYVPIKNETSPVRAECLALPARLTARLEERRTAARPRPFPGTTSRLALAGNRMNDEEKLHQFGAKDDSLSNEEMTSASQEYYLNTNACTSDSDIRDSPKVVTRKKKMVPLSPSKSNTGKSQSDILQLSSTKSVNFRGSSTASPRSSVQITTAQPAPCLNSVRHNSPSTRVPEVVVEANSRQHFNTYTPFPIGSTPSSGSPRRPDQSSQQPYRCVVVDGFGHQHEKTSEGLIKIPKSALALHESVKDGVNGCDNKSVKFAFEGASIVKSDLPLYRNNAIAQYTQEHVYTETDNERLCGLNHKSSPDSEYHIHISQSGLETFDKIFTDHARVVNTAEGDTLSNTRVNDEKGVLVSSGLENNDTLKATYVVKNISQKTATESNDSSHYEFLPNTEEEDLKEKSSCIPQKEHEIIASTTSGKDVLLESGFIDMDDLSLSSDSLSINCNNIEQTPLPETTNTMSENFENIIKIHISPSSRCELSSDTGDSSSETLVKSSRKMYTQGSSVKEFQSVEKHTFEDVSVSHEYTITVDKGKANSEQAWDDTCEENGDWKSAENKPRNIDSEDGDHHDAREDSHGTKEGTLTATDVARDHCLPENDVRTALTGHTYVREHIDIREQSDGRENLDIREKRIEKEDLDERALKNRTKDSLHAEGATDSNVSSSFENSICSKGSPRALEEENFFTSSNQGQMLSQNTESSSKYVSTQSTDPSEEQVLVPSAELGEEQDLASCTELSEEQNLVPRTEPSKEQDWVRGTEPSEVQDLVSRTEPSEEQHLVHGTEPSKEQDLVSCTDPNKEHDRAPGEEQTIIPNTRSSEDQVLILCPDSNTAQLSIPGTEGPENEAEELSDGTDSWDRVTVVRALSADSSGSRNLTPDMNPEVPMSDTLHQEAGEEISIDDFLCMDQQNRFRSPPEASTRSPLLENNSDLLEEIFRAITPSKSEHALVDETSSELSTIEEDDELSDASPLLQQETSLLKESVNTSKEENGNIATLIGMENCDVRSTNCSISSQGSASNAQDKNNIVVEGSENAEVGESEASHVVRESERVVVGGTRGGGANGTLVVDGVDNLLKVKGDGGNVMVECIDDSVAVEGVDDSVAVEDVDDSVAVEDVDDSVAVEDVDDSVAVEGVDDSVAVEGVDDSVAVEDVDDSVDDSVAVEDVDDSVAVEDVDDSVAVEDVDDSVAVEDVDDSVAVEDADDSVAVEDVDNSVAVACIDNSVAVEDVDDSVAVEDVDDSVAVEGVDDSVAVEDVDDSVAVEGVDDSVAVEGVDDSVAVEDVDDSVAVEDVDDSVAVEDADDSVAVEDVDNSVAVEDVDDSVAEEGVDDSVAVEDADDSVAVEDVDDSVAVECVDDSVAVEGVDDSVDDSVAVEDVDDSVAVEGVDDSVAVEDVDDSVAVEDVDDSVAVEDVDNSVAVEDVDDSVAVEDVDDSVAVEDVDDSVAVEGVDDSVAVEDVDDSVAVEDVDDSVAVEDVDDSVAVEGVDDSSVAVEDVDNSVAVEGVDDSVAVEGVDDSVAVEDVDDSVAVEDVDDSVAVEGVDDSVAVEDVDDSVAVEDVDDSVAVGDVDDSFAVEDVDNSVAVEDVDNSVAVEDVDDSVAEEGVDDSVAVEDADDSVAVEDADDSVAVEDVDNSVAVEDVDDSVAEEDVDDSVAVEDVDDSVAVEGVDDSVAVEDVDDSVAVEDVDDSVAVECVDDSVAVEGDSVAVEDVDDSVAVEGVDDSVAVEGVDDSVAVEGVDGSSAIRRIENHKEVGQERKRAVGESGNMVFGATEEDQEGSRGEADGVTRQVFRADRRRVRRSQPQQIGEFSLATTPATSPTHDLDIATTPAASPTHDPDIATTPATSPTHDPDIATTLGTSPTHDPDIATTPATSPTHDPDIATTPATSPTHDPDIATTPATSPTHDLDIATTPAASPTHDPDIATTPATSPTHDPDITTTPATSPTHDPDIATTLGTSPTHDPDIATTLGTSPTHDPDIATTLGTSPTHDPDIATTPEKSLIHDPDIATTLGTSPIHDPDKDVDEKERSAVQGVCRDLENIQHKDIRPKEVSEEESQRQAHDGEETDNSLLSSVTLDLTESVTKGEYDELLNHVEEYIEQKVLIGKRIVPNTYNSHLMRETTLEDGYSIYGESSLRGNYVKGKETPIKSDATAPQGYDNIGDTENEGAEAFASLRSNILMNSDDDIVSCINLEDKSDIRNQVNTGSICREDVHESSCADEVLRHNDGPVAPTMSLAKSSSGACGFSGREDPPQSSLMAGSSTSSDDSPRNRDGNEREAAAAANSPSSDSGVVEMAGKNIQSPSEESAESVAAEVHGSRDTHSQASARSEQSANSIPCPRPSSKQAKDRANRITSGHHSSSGCGRALRETSEATAVNGCASFQDLYDGSDIEDSKPQRRHWESPQRNYFQELSPQIDSDPVSMSRHKLVQEYVDSLQLHQNSGDGSPQGTAGSPPRSTEDTPTDHQSDYEASDSGDASYSERLLKALESRRSRRNRPRSSNIDIEDNPGRYRPSTLSALDMFLATLSKYRGHQLEGGEVGRDSTPPALLPAADDNVTVQVRAGPRQHDVRISSRRQVRLVVNVGNPVASSDSGCVPDTSQSECRGGRAGPPAGGSPGGRRRSRRPGRDGAPAPSRAAAAVNREVDQLLTDVREYLNTKLKRQGGGEGGGEGGRPDDIVVEGSNIEKCFTDRPTAGGRTRLYPRAGRARHEQRRSRGPLDPALKEQQRINDSINAINALLKQLS
nr:uncharacterized protein LOC123757667 [Procambarus clarkii]